MAYDLWSLYEKMLTSRLFEEAVSAIWQAGLISGEMHLGTGEEAVTAGVVDHLEIGDAMALDHRATPPMVMRGVDLELLLQEFLGKPDGLCGGMGGHMHLFDLQRLAASSGIVGASGPGAVGFALANEYLRPGKISVAFFGEGALNQGMLLEALNLASAWNLPVLFVCKDNYWAMSTRSESVTGGSVLERARAFGLEAVEVDGLDVIKVWQAAGELIQHLREPHPSPQTRPAFLLARCIHLHGHYLGDPLLNLARRPIQTMLDMGPPMAQAAFAPKGTGIGERLRSIFQIILLGKTFLDENDPEQDPILLARRKLHLDIERLQRLEQDIANKVMQVVDSALVSESI